MGAIICDEQAIQANRFRKMPSIVRVLMKRTGINLYTYGRDACGGADSAYGAETRELRYCFPTAKSKTVPTRGINATRIKTGA
jgi:hypothetical protein